MPIWVALEGNVNVLIIIYIKFHLTLQKRFLGRIEGLFFLYIIIKIIILTISTIVFTLKTQNYRIIRPYIVVFQQTSKNTFLLWHNRGVLLFLLIFSSTVNDYITTVAWYDAIPRLFHWRIYFVRCSFLPMIVIYTGPEKINTRFLFFIFLVQRVFRGYAKQFT